MAYYVDNTGATAIAFPTFPGVTAQGTISLWIRPEGWSPTDGVAHPFFHFGSSNDDPSFQKWSDNNIYCGFKTGNTRITVAAAGKFSSLVSENWVYTWSVAAGQTLYKNTVSVGTQPLNTPTVTPTLNIGTYSGAPTGGAVTSFADFAYWDVILSAAEIYALSMGIRAEKIRPGSLIFYAPLDTTKFDIGQFKRRIGSTFSANSTATPTYDPPILMPRRPITFLQPASLRVNDIALMQGTSPVPISVLFGHNVGASFTRKVTTIGY